MGTLERALKKLADAGGSETQEPRPAIAKIAKKPDAVAPEVTGSHHRARGADPHRSLIFDLARLSSAGLLSTENLHLADEFRAIKQPLLKKAKSLAVEENISEGRLILVTSAVAGEGKTFSCVNLSLSLAREKDWEVVLVDVDCKNPQLSRLLGVEDEPGLLELLRDPDAMLDNFVIPTNIDGLSVLPLGCPDEHAAELLASARMRTICKQFALERPNALAVFDTSPLLLTTEPLILAQHVGQVLVVVQAGRTPQHSVMAAVSKLDQHKAIGLILNRAEEGHTSLPYGSYGAYPYGTHSPAPTA